MTEKILGYPVSIDNRNQAVERALSWIENGENRKVFVCANPHSLVVADDDPLFRRALNEADLVTPDGIGIVLASKVLGGRIRERVTGSDIFAGLTDRMNARGNCRCFFLGSTTATLAAIKEKFAIEYPNIIFAGSYSPPFKRDFSADDNHQMIEAVNTAHPNVLWVGMTAPKQEKWIYQNKDKLNVNFIGAVGAVFDFYTGNVKRSPLFFQRIGLEWLPRLLIEPRRLWRRTVISHSKFVAKVVTQRFKIVKEDAKY